MSATPENLDPMCELQCIHPDILSKISPLLITSQQSTDLAALFKTLGDPTRIKIIDALSREELCVCDVAELLHLSQSATSHQLRTLRAAKLVKFRRDGKKIYYTLDDTHVLNLYLQGFDHISELRKQS